jgi:hypothetical protein
LTFHLQIIEIPNAPAEFPYDAELVGIRRQGGGAQVDRLLQQFLL